MRNTHVTSFDEGSHMSTTQTVTCPNCQTILRSDRPLAAGARLRCPDCRKPFVTPEEPEVTIPSTPPPAAPLVGAPLLIAVAVSLLLGGAIVTAAIIISPPRSPAVAANSGAAEEERAVLAAERARLNELADKLARERHKAEFAGLLARGEAALAKNKLADAKKAFEEALKLQPDSADALKGLVSAETALALAKSSEEIDGKTRVEVDRLVADAKKAMDAKQYSVAVRLLASAQRIAPANRVVNDTLIQAQKLLDTSTTDQQRLTDFKKNMEAGKAALRAELYPEAAKAFIAALQIMPDDLEAQQGHKQALNKIAGLADKDKRQKALDEVIARGRKALAARRFKDAIAELEAALRIEPANADATRLLKDAQDSLKKVKADNPKLLVQADGLAKLGRIADAKKLVDRAVDSWAEDSDAEKMQKDLDRLMANVGNARIAYQQLVQAGVIAMAAGRYADAVNSYTQALQLMPADLDSALALKQAQAALQIELAAQLAANKAQLSYNNYMKLAATAMTQKAYSNAISAYNNALKLFPNDDAATTGLSQARYNRAMAVGIQALNLRQRANAIAAFQAALKEKPGDAQAQQGLLQAKTMR
jgi:tetratricopeptide (TPR) repeat protein